MKSVIKNNFLFVLFLICANCLSSEPNNLNCTSRNLEVIFVNGVLNGRSGPAKTLDVIKKIVEKDGSKYHPLIEGGDSTSTSEFIKFDHVYNQSFKSESFTSGVKDFIEAAAQIQSLGKSHPQKNMKFVTKLIMGIPDSVTSSGDLETDKLLLKIDNEYKGFVNDTLYSARSADLTALVNKLKNSAYFDKNKVLLVSHSQGNLYANMAYDNLKAHDDLQPAQDRRLKHIANVQLSSPYDGTTFPSGKSSHMKFSNDYVLKLIGLPPNYTHVRSNECNLLKRVRSAFVDVVNNIGDSKILFDVDCVDILGHSVESVYLSDEVVVKGADNIEITASDLFVKKSNEVISSFVSDCKPPILEKDEVKLANLDISGLSKNSATGSFEGSVTVDVSAMKVGFHLNGDEEYSSVDPEDIKTIHVGGETKDVSESGLSVSVGGFSFSSSNSTSDRYASVGVTVVDRFGQSASTTLRELICSGEGCCIESSGGANSGESFCVPSNGNPGSCVPNIEDMEYTPANQCAATFIEPPEASIECKITTEDYEGNSNKVCTWTPSCKYATNTPPQGGSKRTSELSCRTDEGCKGYELNARVICQNTGPDGMMRESQETCTCTF